MGCCYNCKNLMEFTDAIDGEFKICTCSKIRDISYIIDCTHFIAKEDTKEKPKQSAKLSMSCVQPSNHGRKGTMPRSRKGCFKKKDTLFQQGHNETDKQFADRVFVEKNVKKIVNTS